MSPGPKPPYQADTVTARLNSTSGATAPRVGSRMNLAAKAARTEPSANPYLFNLRLNKFIHRPFTSPLTKYTTRDQHPDSRSERQFQSELKLPRRCFRCGDQPRAPDRTCARKRRSLARNREVRVIQ